MSEVFQKNIQNWVSVDNKIKALQNQVKELRSQRSDLTTNIFSYAENNNLENAVIQISDGKLKFANVKQTSPLTYGLVEEALKDCIEITKKSGWSTEPTDTNYNKYVTLPYNKSHEKLHRSDACYDLIITTNFNSSPARKYKGSAIFVHCTDSSKFTDGCVAIPKNQLLCIIRSLKKNSKIVITY